MLSCLNSEIRHFETLNRGREVKWKVEQRRRGLPVGARLASVALAFKNVIK